MPKQPNKPQDKQKDTQQIEMFEGEVLGPDCGTTASAQAGGRKKRTGDASHLIPYRFQKGVSGNPSGLKAIDLSVKNLLIDATPAAAQTLIDVLNDPKASPKLRCQVAEMILNRVYGKAVQPIDASVGGNGDPVVIAFAGVLQEWAK